MTTSVYLSATVVGAAKEYRQCLHEVEKYNSLMNNQSVGKGYNYYVLQC
jgi:hypothetical protein